VYYRAVNDAHVRSIKTIIWIPPRRVTAFTIINQL